SGCDAGAVISRGHGWTVIGWRGGGGVGDRGRAGIRRRCLGGIVRGRRRGGGVHGRRRGGGGRGRSRGSVGRGRGGGGGGRRWAVRRRRISGCRTVVGGVRRGGHGGDGRGDDRRRGADDGRGQSDEGPRPVAVTIASVAVMATAGKGRRGRAKC